MGGGCKHNVFITCNLVFIQLSLYFFLYGSTNKTNLPQTKETNHFVIIQNESHNITTEM